MSQPYDTFAVVSKALGPVSTTVFGQYLAIAVLFVNSTRFGSMYDMAVSLYVCHLIALDNMAASDALGFSTSGPVTFKKTADTAVSYGKGSTKGSDSALNLTTYGKRYLQLCRMFGGATTRSGGVVTSAEVY